MTRRQSLDDSITTLEVGPETLASYLDVAVNSIPRFATDHGMPRTARGRYPLMKCVQWYFKRLKAREIEHPSDLLDERKMLIQAQRVGQELNNARARNELLDADVVNVALTELVRITTAHLDDLPKLAPRLATIRDPSAIAKLVFEACHEVRRKAAADVEKFAVSLADDDA